MDAIPKTVRKQENKVEATDVETSKKGMNFPGKYLLTKCDQEQTDHLGEDPPRWASCQLPDFRSPTFDPLTEQEVPRQRHGSGAMKKRRGRLFDSFSRPGETCQREWKERKVTVLTLE